MADVWIPTKKKSNKMPKTNFRSALIALIALLTAQLAACGGSPQNSVPPQKWHDAEVRVESRPDPPQAGMNEFLVMVTGERGRPVYDVMVSMRTRDDEAWRQAIQDGQVGVYRRAAELQPGSREVLQVQLKRGSEESVLRFPIPLAPK